MITIGLVLWEFYLFKFQTCGFYDFIDIFRFYYIIWIYDFGVDFREVINGDFGLYIYLFYFGKYGWYSLFLFADDFWQRFMNTLGQIQSNTQHLDTLGHIQSNTEQVVKLLTGGGHGFGPHPSAAGSLKRQRAEEADERGRNEEAEKQLSLIHI